MSYKYLTTAEWVVRLFPPVSTTRARQLVKKLPAEYRLLADQRIREDAPDPRQRDAQGQVRRGAPKKKENNHA